MVRLWFCGFIAALACACTTKPFVNGLTVEATEEPVSEDVTAWVFGPDVVADLKFAGKDASVTDESAGKADAATVIDGSDTADVFKNIQIAVDGGFIHTGHLLMNVRNDFFRGQMRC